MNCNQLITLLEIYRGTKITQCGTTAKDVQLLYERGYIQPNQVNWDVTEYGNTKITALLELMRG